MRQCILLGAGLGKQKTQLALLRGCIDDVFCNAGPMYKLKLINLKVWVWDDRLRIKLIRVIGQFVLIKISARWFESIETKLIARLKWIAIKYRVAVIGK